MPPPRLARLSLAALLFVACLSDSANQDHDLGGVYGADITEQARKLLEERDVEHHSSTAESEGDERKKEFLAEGAGISVHALNGEEAVSDKEDEFEQKEHEEEGEDAHGEEGEHGESEHGEGEEEGEEGEEEEEEEPSDMDLAIALMLLGTVGFVMSLFLIVNYPDEDMRYYGWSVISATISIFAAVLSFQALNFTLHEVVLHGQTNFVHITGDFIQMIVHFLLLQVSVALMSGAFMQVPYARNRTQIEPISGLDVEFTVEQQVEFREHLVMCYGTLQAHMSGFAAIAVGGRMQQAKVCETTPALTFVVIPIMYITLIAFCRVLREVRIRLRHKVNAGLRQEMGKTAGEFVSAEEWLKRVSDEPEKYGNAYALTKWDEEVFECENDVQGLCVSFLTIQACRYNISGILPNSLGIEEEHYHHENICTVKLLCVTCLFVLLTIVFVHLHSTFPKSVTPGTFQSLLKRCVTVLRIISSMCIAWGLTYSAKWQIAEVTVLGSPNCIASRVVLATVLSVVAFLMILVLDKIADLECTGRDADTAIISIIYSIGILVGFAWEQAFDGGVEVIAELTPNPVTAELGMAICVSIIVVFPWRKYILPKVSAAAKIWIKLHSQEDGEDVVGIALGHDDVG